MWPSMENVMSLELVAGEGSGSSAAWGGVQVKTLPAVWGLVALPALPLSNYTALGNASLFASSCLDCQYQQDPPNWPFGRA